MTGEATMCELLDRCHDSSDFIVKEAETWDVLEPPLPD